MSAPIVKVATAALTNKKVQKFIIIAILTPLLLIMLVLASFVQMISGFVSFLFGDSTEAKWDKIYNRLLDVFVYVEQSRLANYRDQLNSFMPDFQLNLKKAMIQAEGGHSLLAWNQADYDYAEKRFPEICNIIREKAADGSLAAYLSGFGMESKAEIIAIDKEFMANDGCEWFNEYQNVTQTAIYTVLQSEMPQYEYFEEDITEGLRQTVNVTELDGSRKKVVFELSGDSEIYLPQFLAYYQLSNALALIDTEQNYDSDVGKAISALPDSENVSQSDIDQSLDALNNTAWDGISGDNKNALELDLWGAINLADKLRDSGFIQSEIKNSNENNTDVLYIRLSFPTDMVLKRIFDIPDGYEKYISDYQSQIEQMLIEAQVAQEKKTYTLDFESAETLFQYFGGVFDPFTSAERGETMAMIDTNDKFVTGQRFVRGTDKSVNLGIFTSCVAEAKIIYAEGDTVTIGYIVDTVQFKHDFGFDFPGLSLLGFAALVVEYEGLYQIEDYVLDNLGNTIPYDEGIVIGKTDDVYYTISTAISQTDLVINSCIKDSENLELTNPLIWFVMDKSEGKLAPTQTEKEEK